MLNVEIEEKIKLNSWDRDNFTWNKLKKLRSTFSNILISKDEIKKNKKKIDWVVEGWDWKKYSIKEMIKKINQVNSG